MDYRNNTRVLVRYDYIIVIVSIISLLIYTKLFLEVSSIFTRFLLLFFGLYLVAKLYKSCVSIINYQKAKNIKKNNMTRVNLKLFNKRRRTKKSLRYLTNQ